MGGSDPEASFGKIWVVSAGVGRFGKSKVAVCVDCIVSALGRSTVIPLGFGAIFVSGMSQCT